MRAGRRCRLAVRDCPKPRLAPAGARPRLLAARRRTRTSEYAAGDETPDLARRPDPRRGIDALRKRPLTLPVPYREAVVLCDLQEINYADAAAALDCAVGTVRSRLHRGRALLAAKMRRRNPSSGKARDEVPGHDCSRRQRFADGAGAGRIHESRTVTAMEQRLLAAFVEQHGRTRRSARKTSVRMRWMAAAAALLLGAGTLLGWGAAAGPRSSSGRPASAWRRFPRTPSVASRTRRAVGASFDRRRLSVADVRPSTARPVRRRPPSGTEGAGDPPSRIRQSAGCCQPPAVRKRIDCSGRFAAVIARRIRRGHFHFGRQGPCQGGRPGRAGR